MAWRPAQKDVGITPLDWNFFFYLYTLAFASAFLVPYRKRRQNVGLPFPRVFSSITAIPSQARRFPEGDW